MGNNHFLKFLLVLVVCFTFLHCFSQSLKNKVLINKFFANIKQCAFEILKSGFNFCDEYLNVWKPDYNMFIEGSLLLHDTKIIRHNHLYFYNLQQSKCEIIDGYVFRGHVSWFNPNIFYSAWDSTYIGFKNTLKTDQENSLIQAIYISIRKTGDYSFHKEPVNGKILIDGLIWPVDYLMVNRNSNKYEGGIGLEIAVNC